MCWRGFLTTIAGLSVALVLTVPAIADEIEQTIEQDGHVDRSPTEPPARAQPRSVYKVDDVGMIIGGASEDAKAKVGRLPIRD